MDFKNEGYPIMVDLLRNIFGEITFQHSNSWRSSTYILMEINESKHVVDNEELLKCAYDKYYKRIGNLLKRMVDTDEKLTFAQAYSADKIYDSILSGVQLSIYNEMAKLVGFKPIEKMFSDKCLTDAVNLDPPIKEIDYKMVHKEYPYAFPGKRKGPCFIEAALANVLFMVTFSHEIDNLFKPLDSQIKLERYKKLYSKINDQFEEPKFYMSLINILFDKFFSVIYNVTEENDEYMLKNYTLIKKYRTRKNLDLVLEKAKDPLKDVMLTSENLYDSINSENITDFIERSETSQQLQMILDTVVPLAYNIIIGEIPLICNSSEIYLDLPRQIELKKVINIEEAIQFLIDDLKNSKNVDIDRSDYIAASMLTNIAIRYVNLSIGYTKDIIKYMASFASIKEDECIIKN